MKMLAAADARALLPLPSTSKWPDGVFDVEMLRIGKTSISLFAPHGVDHQTPHSQDEIYVFVSGSGVLVTPDKEQRFEAGDAIHVPAGEVHSFRSPLNFVAWVLFFDADDELTEARSGPAVAENRA